MGKRSESFELLLAGAGVGLAYSFQYVWNVLFAELIKSRFESDLGATGAEVIERLAAVIIPVGSAIAIVWFLYRYIKNQLRDGMAASAIEILYHPSDAMFVREEYPAPETIVTRYFVAICNNGPKTLVCPSLRALESPFVENVIAPAHGVPHHVATPVIWQADAIDPHATEYVELFGVDESTTLQRPYTFQLEVRARDVRTEIAEFRYYQKRSPALRRLK